MTTQLQAGDVWPPVDDAELRRLFTKNMSDEAIGHRLGRTRSAVQTRRLLLGGMCRKPPTRPYQPPPTPRGRSDAEFKRLIGNRRFV